MERILGQSDAIDRLQQALGSGRMHHAWIFHGPKGVGKCTTAVELARVLIDPDGNDAASIDGGTHPDLHVIRKEDALYSENRELRERKLLNIPLDLLRERMLGGRTGDGRLHEAAAYRTAVRGGGKVFIVDEAELMAHQAQNAMLKTLEEPPKGTFLILVTTRPERLLPTVRSRCHQVRFDRLDAASMQRWLTDAASDLPEMNEAARRWIEAFSDGAPGMAMLAATYGFHEWQATIDPMLDELERGRFPAAMGETLAALVETFAKQWVKDHKNASKDAANKDGARHVFGLLAAHARRRMVDAATGGESTEPWTQVIDLVRDAERQMERNVNLKMVLVNLIVQWSRPALTAS